jgi:molybdenum cofactor cytidylyltransferase
VSPRIGAIVLAGGRSSRMGPRNKLLEPIGGKPIVAHVVDAAIASGADPVIVVTGFEAERIAGALSGLDVTLVHNPSFGAGLSSSLRTGLGALPSSAAGTLICLGDMPNVEVSVLRVLMAAFPGPSAICVPVHHGRRGNPLLWGKHYFADMMKLAGDSGAKGLLAEHAKNVVEVEVGTDSIFEDVDAADDLMRLKQSRANG